MKYNLNEIFIEKCHKLAIETSIKAGNILLKHYNSISKFDFKSDGSPVTIADKESSLFILQELEILKIPVISEEENNNFINYDLYWLVDPLDGTKDYIAKNDEFCINIALIFKGNPIIGVIYLPILNCVYSAINYKTKQIYKNNKKIKYNNFKRKNKVMLISRFHDSDETYIFAELNNISTFVKCGSAIKFCKIANDEIDIYPRLVGTSEWDTAAGQAIVEASGGFVLEWDSKLPLKYGKESRRNPNFFVLNRNWSVNDFKFNLIMIKN